LRNGSGGNAQGGGDLLHGATPGEKGFKGWVAHGDILAKLSLYATQNQRHLTFKS
jgi:hypothetical protein